MDWSAIQTSINAASFTGLRSEGEVIQYLTESGDTIADVPAIPFSASTIREPGAGVDLAYDVPVAIRIADLEGHEPGDGDRFTFGGQTYYLVNFEKFGDTYTLYGALVIKIKTGTQERMK